MFPFQNCKAQLSKKSSKLQVFPDPNQPMIFLLENVNNQSDIRNTGQSGYGAPRINLFRGKSHALLFLRTLLSRTWLVQSKLPVNQLVEKLHANSSPQRQLVRALLLLVESRNLIVTGLVPSLFVRSVVTRNLPSC